MKTATIFLLFIVSFVSAQDIEYIKSLNKMDSITASKFAQKIIANTGKDFVFSRTYLNVSKNACNYVYKPKGFKGFCDENCITISFAFNKKGEYYFSSANAKLENLLPTWKELFIPNVTLETMGNYKNTHFQDKKTGLNYYVYTNEYQAQLKNLSW